MINYNKMKTAMSCLLNMDSCAVIYDRLVQ